MASSARKFLTTKRAFTEDSEQYVRDQIKAFLDGEVVQELHENYYDLFGVDLTSEEYDEKAFVEATNKAEQEMDELILVTISRVALEMWRDR